MPGGQGRPGGGMPSGQWPAPYPNGMPGAQPREPSHPNNAPPPSVSRDQGSTVSTMRGGLQLGPPGRWWDDKHFAKSLKLRPEQQKRMDGIFEGNRAALLKSYENLQGEEQRMESLTHARTLDENALFAQIDRVAQARAELEKATTHYLYQIREEMDPDQIERLEEHR